jgi:hypothetical protein
VSCPAAEDERAYQEAWAHLCAYRALAMLTWVPCGVLDQNQAWVGDWSRREAVLAAAGRLREATTEVHALAPVAEAAAGLEQALRSRWPEYEEVLPRWPALLEGRSSDMPGGSPVAPDTQ